MQEAALPIQQDQNSLWQHQELRCKAYKDSVVVAIATVVYAYANLRAALELTLP
jgi:hypothetical protein